VPKPKKCACGNRLCHGNKAGKCRKCVLAQMAKKGKGKKRKNYLTIKVMLKNL
jgi:hypothetical protein